MQIISHSNGRQMSLHPIARRHPLYWCLKDRLILYGGVSEETVGSAHNLTDMWNSNLPAAVGSVTTRQWYAWHAKCHRA